MGNTFGGFWSVARVSHDTLAEATLAAEGMGTEERACYWECVELTLSHLMDEDDSPLHVDTYTDDHVYCDFCGDRAKRGLVVLSLERHSRAVSCALCVHLLEDAARRCGAKLELVLTDAAWSVLDERYPGIHARPTFEIADAQALRQAFTMFSDLDDDDAGAPQDEVDATGPATTERC
jgi:hypothetical protein